MKDIGIKTEKIKIYDWGGGKRTNTQIVITKEEMDKVRAINYVNTIMPGQKVYFDTKTLPIRELCKKFKCTSVTDINKADVIVSRDKKELYLSEYFKCGPGLYSYEDDDPRVIDKTPFDAFDYDPKSTYDREHIEEYLSFAGKNIYDPIHFSLGDGEMTPELENRLSDLFGGDKEMRKLAMTMCGSLDTGKYLHKLACMIDLGKSPGRGSRLFGLILDNINEKYPGYFRKDAEFFIRMLLEHPGDKTAIKCFNTYVADKYDMKLKRPITVVEI